LRLGAAVAPDGPVRVDAGNPVLRGGGAVLRPAACGVALAHPSMRERYAASGGGCQRLENWKLLRAPLRPYFLRSFMRPSRVRYPESRSFLAMPPSCASAACPSAAGAAAGSWAPNISLSARAMPCEAAPACPVKPPPVIVMVTSRRVRRSV